MERRDTARAFPSHARRCASSSPDGGDGCDRCLSHLLASLFPGGRGRGVSSFSIILKNSCHCRHSRHNPRICWRARVTALALAMSPPSLLAARGTTTITASEDRAWALR